MKSILVYTIIFFSLMESAFPCENPEIHFSNSGGMLPQGWSIRFTNKEVEYKWHNRELENRLVAKFSTQKIQALVQVINSNGLGDISVNDQSQIYDRANTNVTMKCGNREISVNDGYHPINEKFSKKWRTIVDALEKEKDSVLSESSINVKFTLGKSFHLKYARIQLEEGPEIYEGFFVAGKNQDIPELKILPGKHRILLEIFLNYDPEKKKKIYKDYDPERSGIWENTFQKYLNSLKRIDSEIILELKNEKVFNFQCKDNKISVN